MNRRKKVFLDTLKKSAPAILAVLTSFVGSAVVFYLYGLELEPFIYSALLISFGGTALFLRAFAKESGKARDREQMIREALVQETLPDAKTLAEEDYSEVVRILREELIRLRNEYTAARQDEIDYYTAWVHQIKTPISVMRMELGSGEAENTRVLEAELFRIEQYVDMVLTYIRLGSGSTDLVIREYPLDELIRETVRRYAPQFISGRLRLNYEGTDTVIITDRKWFSCILDQIISNAIKYTPSGSVTVSVKDDILTVSDTGIGIASEDLPRIFEKGFTGGNGRLDKRSSGLGLYLCKKSAELLQIPLSVKSTVGEGSSFSLDLTRKTGRG